VWQRFLGFFVLQMIWVWTGSLPVIFVNTQPISASVASSWLVYYGIALAVFGFVYEVIADIQKYQFRADPANGGKALMSGLWQTSRHPNYFGTHARTWRSAVAARFITLAPMLHFTGEITHWFGLFVIALHATLVSGAYVGLVSFLSPLLSFLLLMFLSGVPTCEGKWIRKYEKNPEYVMRQARLLCLSKLNPALRVQVHEAVFSLSQGHVCTDSNPTKRVPDYS
jgi:steroid 5-alpha reductase family enzyme